MAAVSIHELQFRDRSEVAAIVHTLHSLHYRCVLSRCRQRLGSLEAAEDAAQEVFIRAADHIADGGMCNRSWLLTVARNVAIDEVRRRDYERRAAGRLDIEGDRTVDIEVLALERQSTAAAIRRLDSGERQLLATRVGRDLDFEDVAARLGISAMAARKAWSRLRAKLHRDLSGTFGLLVLPGQWFRRATGVPHQLLAETLGPLTEAGCVAVIVALGLAGVPHDAPGGFAGSPAAAVPVPSSVDSSRPGAVAFDGSAAVADGPGSPAAITAPRPEPFGSTAGDRRDTIPADLQASPDYSRDRTLYELANFNGCVARCITLWVSRDAGHSWSRLPASGLAPDSVTMLLPTTAADGRFYVAAPSGLYQTVDGGATFTHVSPMTGFWSAAPAASGFEAVVATTGATFGYSPILGVRLLGTLPGAVSPAGPPAWDSDGSLLVPALTVPNRTVDVFRCSLGCQRLGSTGWTVATNLWPVGGTIFAATNAGIAMSADGGQTFRVVDRSGRILSGASMVGGSLRMEGYRETADGRAFAVSVSDDLGGSWVLSRLPEQLETSKWEVAHMPGLAIAAAWGPTTGQVVVCSASEGGTWSAC